MLTAVLTGIRNGSMNNIHNIVTFPVTILGQMHTKF